MKKVLWDNNPALQTNFLNGAKPRSFKDEFAKAQAMEKEHEAARAMLRKAHPGMLALLELKLSTGEPLIMMRPFQYETTEMQTDYDQNGEARGSRFVPSRKTIMPGTSLMLKSISQHTQEFIFVDGRNHEHEISFNYRDSLMVASDVFEITKSYIESVEGE